MMTIAGLSAPQRAELLELFPELADGFAYDAARNELRGKEAEIDRTLQGLADHFG